MDKNKNKHQLANFPSNHSSDQASQRRQYPPEHRKYYPSPPANSNKAIEHPVKPSTKPEQAIKECKQPEQVVKEVNHPKKPDYTVNFDPAFPPCLVRVLHSNNLYPNSTGFLDLPFEIRQRIISEIFKPAVKPAKSSRVAGWRPWKDDSIWTLLLNKQVSAETRAHIYKSIPKRARVSRATIAAMPRKTADRRPQPRRV